MHTATQTSLFQRSTAFALAGVVTLALLAGIDALATHDVHVNALLVQQSNAAAAHS